MLCVDNLLTGRLENIRHLREHPRFRFLKADISQPAILGKIRNSRKRSHGAKFDFVLNLASAASPKDYFAFPIETLQAGSFGTYHALELAKSHGSVFLLSSTSEVYGDPEVTPQIETYWGHVNPVGPRSVYDEAKRFAEALSMAYYRRHGLAVRIARIFNTYGERMQIDDGRVLPNFMLQALQGKPLTVYGDGSQTRSLCYVSDMVEGLYRLLLSNETGPVNIGNPEEVSMLDLAREVIQITNSRSRIAYEPLPIDDPRRRRPAISKAVLTLQWQPLVGRLEGLRRVVPYFEGEVRKLAGTSRRSSPAKQATQSRS